MVNPQGYENFGSLKSNYLHGLRKLHDVFDLEWLKWAITQDFLNPEIKHAISLRIIELEKSN